MAERLEQRLQLLAVRGAAAQLAMTEQRGGGSFIGRALVERSRRSLTARKRLCTRGRGRGRDLHIELDRCPVSWPLLALVVLV